MAEDKRIRYRLGEGSPDFGTLRSDIKKAFPSVSRFRICNMITSEQKLKNMVGKGSWFLAPSSALGQGGHVLKRIKKGLLQEILQEGLGSV